MSKLQIYLVFDCDEWKSRDSMSLVLVTTSVRRLRSFIAKKIEMGDYDYRDSELPKKEQAKLFRKDFDQLDRNTLNSMLDFGFFDFTHDGEEM